VLCLGQCNAVFSRRGAALSSSFRLYLSQVHSGRRASWTLTRGGATHTHTHREKRVWSALRGDGCSHARARVIWFTVMIWSQSRSLLQTCPESVPEHIVLKKSVCACCAEALKRILVFLQVRRALQECAREIPVSVRCAPQTVRDFYSCEHVYSISVCLSARVWRIWRCVFIMHVLWVECAFVDVHCWSFICIPVCVMF